jgi:hypothetical protein
VGEKGASYYEVNNIGIGKVVGRNNMVIGSYSSLTILGQTMVVMYRSNITT